MQGKGRGGEMWKGGGVIVKIAKMITDDIL